MIAEQIGVQVSSNEEIVKVDNNYSLNRNNFVMREVSDTKAHRKMCIVYVGSSLFSYTLDYRLYTHQVVNFPINNCSGIVNLAT